MQISKWKIIQFLMVFLMIISSSILKPLGGWLGETMNVRLVTVILAIVCLLIASLPAFRKNRYLNFCTLLICVVIIAAYIYSDKTIWVKSRESMSLYYVLLAYPLFCTLINQAWNLDSMLNTICGVTFLSYILRTSISLIQKFSGVLLYENIYRECAPENWYRGGFLRINPPCFTIIIIPIALYMIERQVVARRKVKYYLLIASALAYSAVIHGSRSVLVYQIIVLGCYILFKKGSSKRKIAMWVLAGLLVVIFINSTMFSTIVETFTNSTGEYAGSAESRFASVWFFIPKFLQSPLFGTGILTGEEFTFILPGGVRGHLSDIGFFYTITQYGVGILIFDILFIIKGFKTALLASKVGMTGYQYLAFGITLNVLLTGINIDWFYPIFTPAIPVCLAVIEYIYQECRSVANIE
ncbi:TPA: hypothetical protein U2K90_000480 [Enterococcus faecium]|nr:hypothetical protein [Enterococcus faecium]